MIVANILDPVHETLDSIWEDPADPTPKLKERHRKWIVGAIKHVLIEAGYSQVDSWLTLVLTGSLTTYQYSEHSDVDVSLFVNVDHFPDWSRAELIGLMVTSIDGKKLPGTTHPMQAFVVPQGVTKEMLYKPGLRSGYDLKHHEWIVPPERDRVHDVQKEMNSAYVYALECADKMDRLLKYESDKAVFYWHMLHRARQRDQRAGRGDFALSNIVYKFLDKKGLLPEIAHASGEYIAKTGMAVTPEWLHNQQYAYHSAPIDRHDSIRQHGLIPWDHPLSPGSLYSGDITPRPGHTYMSLYHPGPEGYGAYPQGHVTYQIDLQHLDPALIVPDEDHMALTVDKLPHESYGEYAERTGWGLEPEEAQANLDDYSSIAYRGVIPPHAFKVVDHHTGTPSWLRKSAIASEVDPPTFHEHYTRALHHPEFGKHLEPYTLDQLQQPNMRLFLAHGGSVGGALKDHGDGNLEATALFNMGGPRGAGMHMLQHLQQQGANYLTAIGDPLRDKYQGQGWDVSDIYDWDDSMAPSGWDYEQHGRPPVYEMKRTAAPLQNFDIDDDALQQACATVGLEYPVNITIVGGTNGQYMGFDGSAHQINIVGWLRPESANKEIWEELVHALQYERNPEGWADEMQNYWQTYNQGHDAYMEHPWEQEAHSIADNPPFSVVVAPGVTSNKGNSYGDIQEKGRWALEEASR